MFYIRLAVALIIKKRFDIHANVKNGKINALSRFSYIRNISPRTVLPMATRTQLQI